MSRTTASSVLTVRLDRDLERSLEDEARRRHTSKSELVRVLLVEGLSSQGRLTDLEEEARRQSLLVSRHPSEDEVLDFIEHAADTRGWE